jgi:hypothetical protein
MQSLAPFPASKVAYKLCSVDADSLGQSGGNHRDLRAKLNRDEADQIFLDDSFDYERVEQKAIAAMVSKIESIVKVAQWLVLAMTLVVIGNYVRDILAKLNVIGSAFAVPPNQRR